MSADFERLNRDLARDEALFTELAVVGGRAGDVKRWLRERSYRLSDEELERVVSALGGELTDRELDAVSGAGDSLSLQLSMDRRSRYLSTMSNVMGGQGDTTGTMADNLK